VGDFSHAGSAPGGPEIQQDDFSLEGVGKPDVAAVERLGWECQRFSAGSPHRSGRRAHARLVAAGPRESVLTAVGRDLVAHSAGRFARGECDLADRVLGTDCQSGPACWSRFGRPADGYGGIRAERQLAHGRLDPRTEVAGLKLEICKIRLRLARGAKGPTNAD